MELLQAKERLNSWRLTLLQSGHDMEATEQQKFDLVISIAEGKIDYPKILHWLKAHVVNMRG